MFKESKNRYMSYGLRKVKILCTQLFDSSFILRSIFPKNNGEKKGTEAVRNLSITYKAKRKLLFIQKLQ